MSEIGKFLKEKWSENEPQWQAMEADKKRAAEEAERRRKWEAGQPMRRAKSESGRKKASIALRISLWGILCGLVQPVALVYAILSFIDFKDADDQTGIGKAIAATIISSIFTLWLIGLFAQAFIQSLMLQR